MEVDLQSLLFGLHVTWCAQMYSLAEAPQSPHNPALGLLYVGAISQQRYTTSLCNVSDILAGDGKIANLFYSVYLGKFVEYGDEVCIVAAGEDLRLRGEEVVAQLIQQARHKHVQVSTAVNIR